MKHELYFEHVITIGNLYLEHIFLQFEMEPVFRYPRRTEMDYF